MKRIEPGDTVRVQMFDARMVEGQICIRGIINTTSGVKVRVRSGDAVYLIDATQIKKIIQRHGRVR